MRGCAADTPETPTTLCCAFKIWQALKKGVRMAKANGLCEGGWDGKVKVQSSGKGRWKSKIERYVGGRITGDYQHLLVMILLDATRA